jgi:hypothetical protein
MFRVIIHTLGKVHINCLVYYIICGSAVLIQLKQILLHTTNIH